MKRRPPKPLDAEFMALWGVLRRKQRVAVANRFLATLGRRERTWIRVVAEPPAAIRIASPSGVVLFP